MAFSSKRLARPSGVLMIRFRALLLIRSRVLGRPSFTLCTLSTCRPCSRRACAVPRVATRLKPNPANSRARAAPCDLSWLLSEKKTRPAEGNGCPAASCALAKARPNPSATPITSPVDFISGPRIVSTPGNLMKGKTGDFTKWQDTASSSGRANSESLRPTIRRAAILARGTPVALLT